MSKLLKIALGVVALTAVCASMAFAGANAGAVSKLYWQSGTGLGLAARNSTANLPKFIVTVKGLTSFRGADVQLIINGLGGSLPDAWQFQSGGCNEFGSTRTRSFGGAYPTAFSGVPGVADGQNQMYYNVDACLTPHGVGFVWLEAAGSGGVAKVLGTEYGLYACTTDMTTGCAGDNVDANGPLGVCILMSYRQPCNDPANPRGQGVAVVDANNTLDFAPAAVGGFGMLTWQAGTQGGSCPGVDAVRQTTWGNLKKIYK